VSTFRECGGMMVLFDLPYPYRRVSTFRAS
jgi:hypothetical protein